MRSYGSAGAGEGNLPLYPDTLAFGLWCGVGKRTVTRAISFNGNTQKDGSADYKLFSRSSWEPRRLFAPILQRWSMDPEKEIVGVGEAQVWNEAAVTKVPALLVAMYSWLLLAGLKCYGPTRTAHYDPLPKWRSHAKRPSCLDLVRLLRRQLAEAPRKFPTGGAEVTQETMLHAAAA